MAHVPPRSPAAQKADRVVALFSAAFATAMLVQLVEMGHPPAWIRVTVIFAGIYGFGMPFFQWRNWWGPLVGVALMPLIVLSGFGPSFRPDRWRYLVPLAIAIGLIVQFYQYLRRRTAR